MALDERLVEDIVSALNPRDAWEAYCVRRVLGAVRRAEAAAGAIEDLITSYADVQDSKQRAALSRTVHPEAKRWAGVEAGAAQHMRFWIDELRRAQDRRNGVPLEVPRTQPSRPRRKT